MSPANVCNSGVNSAKISQNTNANPSQNQHTQSIVCPIYQSKDFRLLSNASNLKDSFKNGQTG